ncbi:uncharacterized protein LOC124373036 [Homalodisca vitripennis]|uniref:uncharacterized protein LOC124373036 n=1 Tax=Homalodisca vitripennis TaxID=197043 RepID=UPI001EEB8097|nr:uncharacterized protein LOC124373036 [Homalodisca vitripennis]
MPYIVVRGTLGMANTRVYGLGDHEISEIKGRLRFVSKDETKDEVTLYNSVVFVLNQLEYHFGYRVITCTCQGDMRLYAEHPPESDANSTMPTTAAQPESDFTEDSRHSSWPYPK